ncbi:EAL domain-containing protein [Caballeronia pedi]|uniref:EAL domain-containing protein n=1 Tax=Caballeronia pedi TaxID=1777141 RepID=UPI000A401F61
MSERHRLCGPWKKPGAHISLDDFGTGYSNLKCVHPLPLDKVTIDCGFRENIISDAAAQDIVEALLSCAVHSSSSVWSKGMKSSAHETTLRGLSCTVMHGY